jgi:WD40 repeat protein
VLTYHAYEVVCLAYSRDDRFLISVGDYRECSVVIWGTKDYNVLTSSYTKSPIHNLSWDPYTMNEFVSVGQDGNVLFWLLDETRGSFHLNVSCMLW